MQNDLFNVLHHDHEIIMDTIARLERLPADRQTLFDQLRLEIRAHARGEEYAFYPRFAAHPQAELAVRQALREHRGIDHIVDRLKQTSLVSPEWMPLLEELKKRIREHVRLEENELFDLAQKLLSYRQLDDIATEFVSEKEHIAATVSGVR